MNHSPTLSSREPASRGSFVACIVGAGPGGLAAARALKAKGIAYEQFERHTDVGGIWDIDNPGSPMYESAHFISSRDLSGFLGFPMPSDYPDYPSNRQILAYVRSFADAYGLRDNIRFGVSVKHVQKERDGRWSVAFDSGTTKTYDALICSSGSQWDGVMPTYPGHFDGELRHSQTYHSADEFKGKRVVIVGAGNSGADIACDAAANAKQAFISLRRGYHFIPKHIFGKPADVFSETGPHLPLWLARPVFAMIKRMLLGDVSRLGMPEPDHKLFESHPLMNSQLVHYLQHGDISVKPEITRLEGRHVVFKDGSREEIDLVLCATGYRTSVPYAEEYFHLAGGTRPDMFLSIFSRQHRNLFGTGFLETNSAAYKFFDTQAFLVATYLRAQIDGHASSKVFDNLIHHERPDLSGGLKMIGSGRHETYVDAYTLRVYFKKLLKRMGWTDFNEKMYEPLRIRTASRSGSDRGSPAGTGLLHTA